MRRNRERIVKTRADWRKQGQLKKLKVTMTVVVIALIFSLAAGSVLAWTQLHRFYKANPVTSSSAAATVSSGPGSTQQPDNSVNLVLVNASNPLPSGWQVKAAVFDGVNVDERIVPALEKLMSDAKAQGCALKLSGGYIDSQKQEAIYKAEVQRLMKSQHLTQVIAENKALTTVGRGGTNENQTGLAVTFTADGIKSPSDFSATAQYRWLEKNSVEYGFILRFPQNRESVTGVSYNPAHFRYVGRENALKMRQLSMCLEEYVSYIGEQSQG